MPSDKAAASLSPAPAPGGIVAMTGSAPDRIVPPNAAPSPDPAAETYVTVELGDAAPAATAPAAAVDLAALYAQAVALTTETVARAEDTKAQELAATGARLRAEQDSLYAHIMGSIEPAVKEAAGRGQRHATVLRFSGADTFGEFCYLYMIKGPYKHDQRDEMRAMGVRPLLGRLRKELHAHGFGVHHAWQRATNENTLAVTW